MRRASTVDDEWAVRGSDAINVVGQCQFSLTSYVHGNWHWLKHSTRQYRDVGIALPTTTSSCPALNYSDPAVIAMHYEQRIPVGVVLQEFEFLRGKWGLSLLGMRGIAVGRELVYDYTARTRL